MRNKKTSNTNISKADYKNNWGKGDSRKNYITVKEGKNGPSCLPAHSPHAFFML